MSDDSRMRSLMTRALALTRAALDDHRHGAAARATTSDVDARAVVAIADELSRALRELVDHLRETASQSL